MFRDSVRIYLTIAALNDNDVPETNIDNAYLLATCRERVWMHAEPELVHHKGKALIIIQALYSLKSSGASFWAFL